MSRDHTAGAAVLQKLRERITSGCFLGYWQPGQRLPSIRTIAAGEGVDRKTAAAAYRCLQEEGRVEVHPRSGVYLRALPLPQPSDPLERLHRQWLTHAYEGARSLGLDTTSILRIINAVAEVERLRLPVVECDWTQAEVVSRELRARLGVRASPCLLEELRPGDPLLTEAPVIVTTPYHAGEVALLAPGATVVEATLSPGIFRELRRRLDRGGRVLVVTGTRGEAEKVRKGLDQDYARAMRGRVHVAAAENRSEWNGEANGVSTVFLWPGAPDWIDSVLPPNVDKYRPRQFLSESAVSQVQAAILHAAIRRVRTSAGYEKVAAH